MASPGSARRSGARRPGLRPLLSWPRPAASRLAPRGSRSHPTIDEELELDDLSPAERRWRGALTLGLALYGLWCGLTPDRFHWPDAIDLPIHETGHLVFGWGGEVLAALGGTIFQLIMPLAFVGYFLRRRDAHAASVALWWVGQNCWNIARYVADARAQELPLVGGGEHDWAFLLATWDRLARDQIIARDVRLAGWVLVAGATWLGWRALASAPVADDGRSPAG